MSSLRTNIAYSFRFFRNNSTFASAVVITLALGIAANTTVFTVTNAVILRPLPYDHPERLVLLDAVRKAENTSNGFTLNRYDLLRQYSRSLSAIAVATEDSLNITGAGLPQQATIARVSGNFFSILGMQPQIGRLFTDSDARPESAGVVLLSDQYWRTTFHGDHNIIDHVINLDSIPYTVIGVLPANAKFPFLGKAELWLPRYFELSLFTPERLRMGVGYLTAIGRLAPGSSMETATAEMRVLDRQYTDTNPKAPDAGSGIETKIAMLQDSASANLRPRLLVLSAAVAFVLLIACANAANLLLWRALARGREIAIRTVLGAKRNAIIAQLLTESISLALIAGVIGSVLSLVAVWALIHFGPEGVAGFGLEVDWRVLLFTLVTSLLTGVIFGIVPALQISRTDPQRSLRAEGIWSTSRRSHAIIRHALLITQIALSLILLVGSSLLVRSFARLVHTELGFDATGMLTANISLPTKKYPKAEQQVAFFHELLPRIENLPGVSSAAISSALPPMKKRITPILAEGQPNVPLMQRPLVTIEMVSPGWFQTMRVPLSTGRDFSEADTTSSPKVLIANESFVRRFWPNENPIGRHVQLGRQAPAEIVGISGNVKNNGITADPQPQLYVPYAQLPWSSMNLLIRTTLEPHSLISTVREQVLAMDREQPLAAISTAEELLNSSRAEMRFTTLVLGAFSFSALVLALIGLYGVLAYSIAQRRRELAIRIALGATSSSVTQLVMGQGLILVCTGILSGLVLSAATSRLLSSLLYKISSIDAISFTAAPLFFLLTASAAIYLPARRASTTSPLKVLRE